jgi:hypothetical protein
VYPIVTGAVVPPPPSLPELVAAVLAGEPPPEPQAATVTAAAQQASAIAARDAGLPRPGSRLVLFFNALTVPSGGSLGSPVACSPVAP